MRSACFRSQEIADRKARVFGDVFVDWNTGLGTATALAPKVGKKCQFRAVQ